jgi:hypothetical protein
MPRRGGCLAARGARSSPTRSIGSSLSERAVTLTVCDLEALRMLSKQDTIYEINYAQLQLAAVRPSLILFDLFFN